MKHQPALALPAIAFASRCDRGLVRAENQDSVLCAPTPLGEILIVADGIGGYAGGAVASRLAVETIQASFAAQPATAEPGRAIQQAAYAANAAILAAARAPGSPYGSMGSTVVLALLPRSAAPAAESAVQAAPMTAWFGHIGDSRAYLFHRGQLGRLTRDHSSVQSLVNRNLITPQQALTHPDAHVLTRSLGHQPHVEIDVDSISLESGDTLMLCSDGLWGFVPEPSIGAVLANPALSADSAAQALLALALGAGGHDNIGIQLARIAVALAAKRKPSPFAKIRALLHL